jgi:hypothetical protein
LIIHLFAFCFLRYAASSDVLPAVTGSPDVDFTGVPAPDITGIGAGDFE